MKKGYNLVLAPFCVAKQSQALDNRSHMKETDEG